MWRGLGHCPWPGLQVAGLNTVQMSRCYAVVYLGYRVEILADGPSVQWESRQTAYSLVIG